MAAARGPLAVRGPRRRQHRLRPHAADPVHPGPQHRPRRRARLARAAARRRRWPRTRTTARPPRSPSPAPCRRSSRSSASRARAIVVLDEQGQTTLADQTASPAGDEDDRTRVRAPQAVAGPGAGARAARPAAYPPLSGSTSIPAAAHTRRDLAARPALRCRWPGRRRPRRGGHGPGRPRPGRGPRRSPEAGRADCSAGGAADPHRDQPGASLLSVVAAVVVALLVGVAVWAVVGRGDGDPRSPAPPDRGRAERRRPAERAPGPDDRGRRPHRVRCASRGPTPGREKGDTFRFRQAHRRVGRSPRRRSGRQRHHDHAVVKVAKGTQVCAPGAGGPQRARRPTGREPHVREGGLTAWV